MRIVCDNCGAKYQISDEKVRNKVFKIRCKRCTHVIVVRAGQDQAAEAAQQSMEEPARLGDTSMAEEQSDAIWYVVVNREQLGPMTRAEVEGRFERGEVDSETFAWAEGMAEWVRLGSIQDFSHLAPAAAALAPAQAAAPVQAAAPAAARFAPAAEADDDVIASNNRSAGGASPGLFGRDEDGFDEGPRVSSARHLRGQRNENSVLFSLDSLAADVEARPVAAAAVSNTGGSEGSGLIDIAALGSRSAGALDSAFGGGGGGFAPVPAAPAGPLPSLVTRPSGNGLKVALLVVGILLLVGGGVVVTMLLLDKDKPTAPVAAAPSAPVSEAVSIGAPPTAAPQSIAPATVAAPATAAAAASEAPASEAPASLAALAPATEARAGERRPVRAPRPGGRPARPGDTEDDPTERVERAAPATVAAAPATAAARKPAGGGGDEVDALLGSLDGNKPGRQARPADGAQAPVAQGGGDDPLLPERLSKQQILMVVKNATGGIRECKSQDPDATGTVMVAMVIEPKGNVSSASIAGGPLKGSPAGSCVEQKVKAFKFPQFRGEPMRINMPFGL